MIPLLLVVIAAAPADPDEASLAAGRTAYESYKFKQAIKELDALVARKPKSAAIRQSAELLLAFSYFVERNEAQARQVLRELLVENPDVTIDRDAHSPPLLAFFDEERESYMKSLAAATVVVAPVLEPPRTTATAPVAPPQKTSLGDRHPWLRVLPLGIGHFVNADPTGGAFLALELACVGFNVGGALWFASLRNSDGTYRDGAFAAQVLQNVGAFGVIVVAIIEIVDAFAWSPARGRARLNAPVVDLGPIGEYTLRFTGN